MSRSYKKHPCWGDDSCNGIHSCVHFYKNYSNRLVRKPWHWDLPSGSAYRRVLDPWTIRDHQCVLYTKQQVMDEIEEAEQELRYEMPPHKDWRRGIITEGLNFSWLGRLRKHTLMYYYYSK